MLRFKNRYGCWVLAGLLIALGRGGLHAQQSDIRWSSMNSGFVLSSDGQTKLKAVAGQVIVGDTRNNGLQIISGFLADTSLRGLILAAEDEHALPSSYSLSQNFPNPFNPTTNIEFRISSPEVVTLKIYDVVGRELETLLNEPRSPGRYVITWEAGGYSSGVYFYRLHAGTFVQSKTMLLVK
jgi:hypothetical protein